MVAGRLASGGGWSWRRVTESEVDECIVGVLGRSVHGFENVVYG